MYNKLNFGEFVDLTCFLALHMFQDSEMSTLAFEDKLKYFLKDLLMTVDETLVLPPCTV